jgi:hypothetical protein
MGNFVVCVLCEIGWQQMMGGQERFKLANEMGIGCSWTRIRRGVRRQGSEVCVFVDCICGRSCKTYKSE